MPSLKEIKAVDAQDYSTLGLAKTQLLWMFSKMVEIRAFEEKVEQLYLLEGAITGPAHLCIGQEAVAVGVMAAIEPGDQVISGHRGHGHALALNVPAKYVMAELFGRSTGTCRGMGGSMHVPIYAEKAGLFASAIVGSGIPIAVGVGLAFKYNRSDRVCLALFGDGALSTGAFHEATNLAAIWKVPTILVCENNMYAIGMKIENAMALEKPIQRALGYGIPGITTDGSDPISVYLGTSEAVRNARDGKGPTLVECRTYRWKGHGIYDKAPYRPKEEVEEQLRRDPIQIFRRNLLDSEMFSLKEIEDLERRTRFETEESVRFARESPTLSFSELWNLVYA